MADIRIKDLTTTASSSASDDFIAVDGTTNGTRKLNAFSPTFGGNATVTGTLSSGGNLSVTGTSAQVILGQASSSQLTYLIRGAQAGGAIQIVQDALTVNRWLSLGRSDNSGVYVEAMRLNDAGVVSISATTASTTTSSGALVVGNGSSGGLGVGGSINAGGNVTISGSNGYAVIGGRQWSFRANGSGGSPASGCVIRDDSAAADRLTIDINGNTSVLSTTASTSTSSGALVVSGGVGVAGAIYAANLGGTSTNNNAASGCIGEYASATTAYASKVSLTSNTAANIVSISLTAGDWDVQFNPVFTQDTSLTTSGVLAGVSSSSGVLPSGAAERAHSPSGPNGNSDLSIAPPVTRISLASTTTIYGVATGIFSAGTMSAYGFIRARRVR